MGMTAVVGQEGSKVDRCRDPFELISSVCCIDGWKRNFIEKKFVNGNRFDRSCSLIDGLKKTFSRPASLFQAQKLPAWVVAFVVTWSACTCMRAFLKVSKYSIAAAKARLADATYAAKRPGRKCQQDVLCILDLTLPPRQNVKSSGVYRPAELARWTVKRKRAKTVGKIRRKSYKMRRIFFGP
jgi:hypothetical protein